VCPGRAGQTRAEWLDDKSRSQIKACARFIYEKAKIDGFPLERVSPHQVASGGKGYCGHVDISDAYGLSDHWDPGSGFPWDVLAADIAALTIPNPDMEDNMQTINPPQRVYDSREPGKTALKAGEVREIAVTMGGRAVALNLTVVPSPHVKGYLTVWPAGEAEPKTSNVNWSGNDGSVANTAIVGVTNSRIKIKSIAACHVIIDLQALWP
jgi:hypothetical protein